MRRLMMFAISAIILGPAGFPEHFLTDYRVLASLLLALGFTLSSSRSQ